MSTSEIPEKTDDSLATRALIRQMSWITLTLVFARLLPLISQSATSHISDEYLTAISLLSYLMIISTVVGNSLGLPLLVILGRENDQKEKRELLGSVYVLGATAIAACSVGMILFKNLILSILGLQGILGIDLAYYLTLGLLFMRGVNLVSYFAMSATDARYVMILDVILNVVTIAGSFYAILQKDQPGDQFAWVIIAALAAEVVYFFGTIAPLKKLVSFRISGMRSHWDRCKLMVTADAINLFLQCLTPFLVSIVFLQSKSKEAVAALNVGYRLVDLFLIPSVAVVLSGTPWLASLWRHKHTTKWESRTKLLWLISSVFGIALLIATFPFLSLINNYFFGLKDNTSLIIVGAVMMSALPYSLGAHLETQYRVCEKQTYLTKSNLIANYFIGLPLSYICVRMGYDGLAAIFGVLIPDIVFVYWLYSKLEIIGEMRRHTPRFAIPAFLNATVKITQIGSERTAITISVIDLGLNGCALKDSESLDFPVGEKIAASLYIQNNELFKFNGIIKNRMVTGEGFWGKRKLKRLGVQFSNLTPHNQSLITLFLDSLSAKPAKAA